MKSSQTMTTEELYHIGAYDYDSVYMSQVRIEKYFVKVNADRGREF